MGIIETMLWGILVIIIVLIILVVIDFLTYKHNFRVRKLTSNRVIIFDVRAKITKDKNGIEIFYIKGHGFNTKLPVPPPDAIEINNKGRFCIEAYYTEDGAFVYLKNTDIKDAKEGSIEGFEPLTTNQRSFLVDQATKSAQDKGFDWKQNLPVIASGLVLIIIFVIALSFWGDVMQPVLDFAENQADIAQIQSDMMEKLQEIIQDKQTMSDIPKTQPPN